jgi:hypothetical protein
MLEAELKRPVIAISAATGAGCTDLLETCWTELHPQGD